MMDINFYMAVHKLKYELMSGNKKDSKYVLDFFEAHRSKHPIVYNIETTNYCNMTCIFCPRTTLMTRKLEHMTMDIFKSIIDQLIPHSETDLKKWDTFVKKEYNISEKDVGENHFLFYVIAKAITLHGWGSPFLDQKLAERIALLNSKGFKTYFSCNPTNIKVDFAIEMFQNGLDFMKLSIESINDDRQIELRGDRYTNFWRNLEKLDRLLEAKKKFGYKTMLIVTMLNMNTTDQIDEYNQLEKVLEGKDVYLYLKNRDNQWNMGTNNPTTAIHWSEFCQDPWSSFGIQNNGLVSACGREDYNNELIMGDIQKESLLDIWNGERYREFRKKHFEMPDDLKCTHNCDAKMVGSYVHNAQIIKSK